MQIVTAVQHRVLAFVEACNRNQYRPTEHEVMEWLTHPEPHEAVYETRPITSAAASTAAQEVYQSNILRSIIGESDIGRSIIEDWNKVLRASFETPAWQSVLQRISALGAVQLPTTRQVEVRPAETPVAHLLRIGWLATANDSTGRDGEPLRVTELGSALLHEAELGDQTTSDVTVVVLGRDDPLAYPLLIGQLASVGGAGLLVDPFLRVEQLHQLITLTSLTRILVSGKDQQRGVRAAMSAYLGIGSLNVARDIEVRASTRLHDRVLVAEDGSTYTLGTSLNGVGRTTTVFSPMPAPASEALSEEYEEVWESAELVGPQPPDDEDDAAGDGEEGA